MFTKYHLFFKYAKQKNSILTTNRLFTKCPKPLFQSEGNCEAIDAKMTFIQKTFSQESFCT